MAVVSDAHKRNAKQLFPNATVFTVPNFPRMNDYNQTVINRKINSFNQDSKLNLVYIGGLDNNFDRDMDLQLKIAQKVLNHNKNARFIVGGTDCSSMLEKKLNDYSQKYQDRFQYLGVVPHRRKIEITEEAHIGFFLIRPSSNYWVKASPNKVFEYLICGVVPVIRADIDYAQEISNLSLKFSRNTSEEDILCNMLQLIEDPKRIQDIMTRARDLSKKFTWESVACRYIEFYKSVLDS